LKYIFISPSNGSNRHTIKKQEISKQS